MFRFASTRGRVVAVLIASGCPCLCLCLWLCLTGRAAAEPVQPSAQKIMLVVAHPDDDMMLTVPDLVGAFAERRALRTVYLTGGDAGFACDAYTQGREAGVKAEQARLAGVPAVWRDEERLVQGKRVRFSYLQGTKQSLAFIGLPNPGLFSVEPPEGALQKLWLRQIEHIDTLPFDGRSGTDSYTREGLIELLRALMAEFEPDDVRVLDASQLQIPIYPFEHVDHMGSAMFATAAFQRYARAESISFYPLYSIQFMPPNLPAEAASLRRELVETYRPHDAKICTSWFTTICGVLTTCDLMAIYKPFWPRSYTVDTLRGKDVQIRSPSGQCLDARSASEVTLAPCDSQRGAQRWTLDRGGVIRSSAHARCLSAASLDHGAASSVSQASQSLGLAGCARVPAQQFYLTSQGQLRGPEATCVREERTRGLLEECAPGTSQRSWQAR